MARKSLKRVKQEHPAGKLLIRWILGHMGIEGNEMADEEAKRAARGDASPQHPLPTALHSPLPASLSATRQTYGETLKQEAAAHLMKSKQYACLRAIDASAPSKQFRKLTANLTCKQANLLVQLRTGHVPLNQHLAHIGAVKSPLCPACCEKEETVIHFLMSCPAYAAQHDELHAQMSRDAHSISHLLSHPKAMKPLFRFIATTHRLTSTFDSLSSNRQRTQNPTS